MLAVRKTFILSISDCESLQTTFVPDKCTNKLNISAKYFHETINSFSNDTDEITFMVEANKLCIKNYIEPEMSKLFYSIYFLFLLSQSKAFFVFVFCFFLADGKPLINTQVNFDSDEFNNYEIEKESDITFCLKEFKVEKFYNLNKLFKNKSRSCAFRFVSCLASISICL